MRFRKHLLSAWYLQFFRFLHLAALAGVAQLAGVLSCTPEGCEVVDLIPSQGAYRRQPTDVSHIDVFFSFLSSSFLPSSLFLLPSSLSKINLKILIPPSNIHCALLGTVLGTWKQRHTKIYKLAGDMNK